MKKIIFSLQLGLIGHEDSGKNLILEFLRHESIPIGNINNIDDQVEELQYTVVHEQIPIKIKVFRTQDLNSILNNSTSIKKFDVLILALNLYHLNSKNDFHKNELEKFIKKSSFKGISALIGFDMEKIEKGNISRDFRISRYNLIQKVKELDLMYCFEIKNNKKDLFELYQILLNDYIFKLSISNPELLEKSKKYGNELIALKVSQ